MLSNLVRKALSLGFRYSFILILCLAMAFIVFFPTILLVIGLLLVGVEMDWQSWKAYAGIGVFALFQGVRWLADNDESSALLEGTFTFPKR